jgi:hypothetical protein
VVAEGDVGSGHNSAPSGIIAQRMG